MTDSEILQKALEKAIQGGYDAEVLEDGYAVVPLGRSRLNFKISGWAEDNESYHIIFSHEFAKAFFGEELAFIATGVEFQLYYERAQMLKMSHQTIMNDWEHFKKVGDVRPIYLYHLQQMVIEQNPLQYLARFL